MKITKRTIGAFTFLAAFVMMMSVMTPLTDAGADNSAPVLFSNESEDGSFSDIDILGTWTNEDGLTLKYAQAYYHGETKYGLIAQFDDEFPLTTYNTIMPKLDTSELLKVAANAVSIVKADKTLNITLNGPLTPGEHIYCVYDPDHKDKTLSSVNFTIGSSYIGVITSNYFASAENAKAAINAVLEESRTDVADKTMFIIYNQIGTFTNDVIGELYFNDTLIYSETLKNENGQRIWYFTFNQPNANGDSISCIAGEYVMKLVSNGEVVADGKATISAVMYTISATAGENGSITPSGTVTLAEGSSQTFTFTPNAGFEIDQVLVDGSPVEVTENTYSIENVTENHSIKVTFVETGDIPQKLIIEVEAGKGGSISPSENVEVITGGNQTFTITSDSGYKVDKVLVDNNEVSLTDGKYTFSNVTENHSIKVTFVETGETPTPSGDSGKDSTMYYIIAAIVIILIIVAIVYFVMKK
ncbi:hypothetical protein A3206_07740 [Candidatus Methanomassiliicoccus intestinalis]|nr:MAG: hypothetical protein A3206_07740 [Candidatus Methanomassiliicoccus intestinalis]